jgi:hypothetical protein
MRGLRYYYLLGLLIALPLTAFVIGEEPKPPIEKLTSVVVQEFEKTGLKPEVWVVNIPGENAKVQLSADHPQEGKQGLKLHYRFTAGGNVQ